MKDNNKEHVFLNKIAYSAMILMIYICGRKIPVLGVDTSAYQITELDAQAVFLQSLSGDFNNVSIFILGIWPYIIASMIAMVYGAIRSLDKKTKMSKNHINKVTIIIMLIIGVIQAYQKAETFVYKDNLNIELAKAIAIVELMAGMLLVIYMCDMCQKYGIGGKSAVFLVNIFEGILKMTIGREILVLLLPLGIGILEAMLMIILENTEKRIPVQRVSIHSIYADKNYIAYKFNPIGIMPIMFATAFFALTQMFISLLAALLWQNERLQYISDNMSLAKPMGMITYIVIIAFLNITFSFIMLMPHKAAEGLLKTGDSLEDIQAGKKTARYLSGTIFRLSLYSSIVFGCCLGISFYLQYRGMISQELVMLPSSLMMSTGLWVNFFREAEVYRNWDRYEAFI